MDKIFDLQNPMEGFDKVKVNFVIDDELVNGDLGEVIIEDEKEIFVPKYTSAVIPKSQIKNYTEE